MIIGFIVSEAITNESTKHSESRGSASSVGVNGEEEGAEHNHTRRDRVKSIFEMEMSYA